MNAVSIKGKQVKFVHPKVTLAIKSRFVGIEKQGKDSIDISDMVKSHTQNK